MRNSVCCGVGVIVLAWAGVAMAVAANDGSPLRVDCRGGGDYTTIQAALDAACCGDEIAVAPGTYCESIDFLGKAVRLYSLAGAESTIIDGTGRAHVVRCVGGEGPDTILEGFTITGGNASGYYDSCGAGLNTYGEPTVNRCTFTRNVARFGGAICGRARISHCLFVENDARMGGALWRAGTVADSAFVGNTADMGGAINDAREVIRCDFITNVECIFEAGRVADCTFRGNFGGAALGNAEVVTNCVFIGNDSALLTRIDLHATVTHCTFLNNGVALTHAQNGLTTMANCIIWGSTSAAIEGPAVVTYSSIEGGWEGEGNIDVDPLFADGEGRLLAGSPCIDAGTNEPPGGPTPLDIAGDLRPADGDGDGRAVADMGAYERPDPAQLVETLIEAVAALELPQRAHDCLLTKLQSARAALEDRSETSDQVAAIHLLSFINAVQSFACQTIPQADAEALVAAAQRILDLLDGVRH